VLDPKEIAAFDQANQALAEAFPPMLRGFYEGLLRQGFDPGQAFGLTNTFLYAIVSKPAEAPQ
jgi:hypothetical protein